MGLHDAALLALCDPFLRGATQRWSVGLFVALALLKSSGGSAVRLGRLHGDPQTIGGRVYTQLALALFR